MRRHLLVLLVIAAGLSACAHAKRYTDDEVGGGRSSLQVVNHNFGDVDIFLAQNGQRTRIGNVSASSEQTFALPASVSTGGGSLQLIARAIGSSSAISSETIAVRPGGMQLSWTIEQNLSRASLAIY